MTDMIVEQHPVASQEAEVVEIHSEASQEVEVVETRSMASREAEEVETRSGANRREEVVEIRSRLDLVTLEAGEMMGGVHEEEVEEVRESLQRMS
mmetsp:Transcript_45411/g.176545  ORF Transcript_45411/g.176545 Transcript_45411/m.176545 type:complete len:95 (-) Transcript_45411:2305-2589(-)